MSSSTTIVSTALEKANELSLSLPLEQLQSVTSGNQTIQKNTVIQLTQINIEHTIHTLPVISVIPDNCDIKLSERQELILNQLYETIKETMRETLSLESMDHAMKIGRMMAEIVKLVEKARYSNQKIHGAEKREIALALGKRLVSDHNVIQNDTMRNGLMTVYDVIGEQLLETLLDVSRHVNTVVQQAALSCMESIVECIRR